MQYFPEILAGLVPIIMVLLVWHHDRRWIKALAEARQQMNALFERQLNVAQTERNRLIMELFREQELWRTYIKAQTGPDYAALRGSISPVNEIVVPPPSRSSDELVPPISSLDRLVGKTITQEDFDAATQQDEMPSMRGEQMG